MRSLQAAHRYLQATRESAGHAVQIEIFNLAAVGLFHRNDRGFLKPGSDWRLGITAHGQWGVMIARVTGRDTFSKAMICGTINLFRWRIIESERINI